MCNFKAITDFSKTIAVLAALFVSAALYAQTSIFINEFHYDNTGTDASEAIEIAGPAGTDLNGWSIVLYNGASGLAYNTTTLNGLLADAGTGYGFVTINYPANGLQNGAPDGIALVDNFNNVVQFLSYEGAFTAADGAALGLTSTGIGVSESGNTEIGFSLQLSGSGVNAEDFSWRAAAPATFGSVNNNQSFGAGGGPTTNIIINEFDADNPGTDAAEFIELFDGGAGNTALDGLVLVLFNGSDDASYAAFNLTGFSTNAEGYFVLCGNSANVANCDLDVSPDSNLIQNGADAVALYIGAAADFPNDTPVTTTNLIDAVVYGTNDAEDAGLLPLLNAGQGQLNDTTDASLQRCPNGAGGQRNTAGFLNFAATPGAENICVVPATFRLISEIQGAGTASPLVGTAAIVEAVVVGDFQGADQLNGFYLQEEDADADANPETSEGIFVFAPDTVDVQVGDVVRVTGEVAEFFNLTELTNVSDIQIVSSGHSVTPATVSFPVNSDADFERLEGMQVALTQPLVITEYFNYDRFGEMVLALPLPGESRPLQPTAVVAPGAEAVARLAEIQARRITLDDGSTQQNPALLRHPNGLPFSLDNRFRGGDTLTEVAGVMDYRFGQYRIQPTQAANHIAANPRPDAPQDVLGSIKVSSFNVLNYFTTFDTAGALCGPGLNLGCRGADNAEEFQRQRAKIIDAITHINADIFGLIELENNSTASLTDLVDGINAQPGAETFAFIDTGTIGGDAIKAGIIYQPAKVKPSGAFKVLDASVDSRFIDSLNRPVLAQSFIALDTGARFTLVVNHLKSKGSACDAVGDPDLGDGQGNCNKTREQAAIAEVEWLATDPTGSDDGDYLIMGDLNAYAQEDPVTALRAGVDGLLNTDDDYTNLLALNQGDAAYSFVFDGQFGYLDHALASSTLAAQVSGVTEWHINADEPDILDYNTDFKPAEQSALFEANAFRSSDHDPVIVGLNLRASVSDIVRFMHEAIADGTLIGGGRKPARRLSQFVRIVLKAEYLAAKGNTTAACRLLQVAQSWSDGIAVDRVAGPSAAIVSTMIANYRQVNCPQSNADREHEDEEHDDKQDEHRKYE